MADEVSAEIRYGVDRLVESGRRIFGWGWVAGRRQQVLGVTLVASGDGWEREIPVNFGLARPDVATAFPECVEAASSGFVVTGYLPAAGVGTLAITLRLADGTTRSIDVTRAVEVHYAHARQRRVAAWLLRAVWRRLKRLDIRGIVRRARAQSYTASTLDDLNIAERLLPRLASAPGVTVVFDHNMGGGANQYRRGVIAERVAAGHTVLFCTYNLPTLDYRLHVHAPGRDEEVFRISTFVVLEYMLDNARIDELFVNSPVSFDEPLLFAEWLTRSRAAHPSVRLTLTVHDYLAVCPSFVLLDADGRYCGIPSLAECSDCLRRHQGTNVALSPPTDIGPWRSLWGRCLAAADEVRCFSESARRHILRAYPGLDAGRVSVVPHRVDFRPARRPRIDHAAPLTIGVLGQISVQKGAGIIREVVQSIGAAGIDARIVVLGTLDLAISSPRLRVTGPYERTALTELIEAHGINMFLFPSICPETFSYVIEEMIALDVPIVAFDLGAPGERLRQYANGRIVADVSGAAALDACVAFHARLAAGETAVA
jgi:glycosyltransferase involved in cell wall biosynthesis